METIKRPKKTPQKKIICKTLCLSFRLTTVQHRGQNHHIMSRASSRKTTSNEMSTMVPSNCENRKHNGGVSGHARLKAEDEETTKKKGEKQKPRYSQPPLMDRHNRGDLREEGQRKRKKKKTTEPRGSEKLEK